MSRPGRRRVLAVDADHPQGTWRPDTLAVEEPLELRVGGAAYTTTMRTPGHDVELAHGLLVGEGIITGPDDVRTARYCAGSVVDDASGLPRNTYNVLDVALAPGITVPDERRRHTLTTAACGVCGTASIDLVRADQPFDLTADTTTVTSEALWAMADTMREAQTTFDRTGGVHAAGLFDADGTLLVLREDVGRHNAVDKVLGWALLQGLRPARGTLLFVSGRASFELVQKAVMGGVPILAAVSAPSSLAAETAGATGLTLVGFVRPGRLNAYTHTHRLGMDP